MSRRIVETAPALKDLAELHRRGEERFGAIEAEKFIRSIFERFDLLAGHPEIGPSRAQIRPGLRLYFLPAPIVIAYRFTEDELVILRVFHGRENYESILARE